MTSNYYKKNSNRVSTTTDTITNINSGNVIIGCTNNVNTTADLSSPTSSNSSSGDEIMGIANMVNKTSKRVSKSFDENNIGQLAIAEMRDIRSFSGISCPTKNMTVSPNGCLLAFRKSYRQITIFAVPTAETHDLLLSEIDVCHENDNIYLIAFVDNDHLAVLLQDRENAKLYICRARIDFESNRVNIDSLISDTRLAARNGFIVEFLRDERGLILISYPRKFNSNNQDQCCISLFPLNEYFERESGRKLTVGAISSAIDDLWTDPFISRNTLYFFNTFDRRLLCVYLGGDQRGNHRLLNTYTVDASRTYPSRKFMNRSVQVLTDSVLVYFHHRADRSAGGKPQLWRLDLNSLEWMRLSLRLSHHYPTSRICFEKSESSPIGYLHGDCSVNGCRERAHLYQLMIDDQCRSSCKPYRSSTRFNQSLSTLVSNKWDKFSGELKRSMSASDVLHQMVGRPTTITTTANNDLAPLSTIVDLSSSAIGTARSVDQQQLLKPSNDSITTTSVANIVVNSTSPSMRYYRQHTNNRRKMSNNRPTSTYSVGSTISLPTSSTNDNMNRRLSVHWSEQMAHEGPNELVDQLTLAKQMGYTDDEIIMALNLNSNNKIDDPNSYRTFESTNTMIDMLTKAKSLQNTATSIPSNTSCHYEQAEQNQQQKASSITCSRRSPPTSPIAQSNTLQRLLDAFERERKSYHDESQKSIALFQEKYKQTIENVQEMRIQLREKDAQLDKVNEKLNDYSNLERQFDMLQKRYEEQLAVHLATLQEMKSAAIAFENAKKQYEIEQKRIQTQLKDSQDEVQRQRDEIKINKDKLSTSQLENDTLRRSMQSLQTDIDRMIAIDSKDEIRKLSQQIERLKRENHRYRSEIVTCVVCLENKPEILFLPCSHFVCCANCGKELDKCPTCRAKLSGKCIAYQ